MGLNAMVSEVEVFQIVAMFIKILVVVMVCMTVPPLMVWVERRAPALIQRRKGPNRVGVFQFRIWGLMQAIADAVKLIFKEEIVPAVANRRFFHIAPMIGVIPALLTASAIPFGPDIELFGYVVPLTVINVDAGFLFILAISSLGVYGITLAGWASNNKYSLLGSLRSSAQMVSYEIPLGLSLIPLVMIFSTFKLNDIVVSQNNILGWGVFLAPISFFLFAISMFAETNRAPFDLAEADSELVAGFHTEFGSTKFALFFFAEYINMFVLSCLCATLFFGGWQIPFVSHDTVVGILQNITEDYASLLAALVGMLTLIVKAAFFMWFFVWVRWTLPRFRYDQLMGLGWKFLLPLGLFNIAFTALIIAWRTF